MATTKKKLFIMFDLRCRASMKQTMLNPINKQIPLTVNKVPLTVNKVPLTEQCILHA